MTDDRLKDAKPCPRCSCNDIGFKMKKLGWMFCVACGHEGEDAANYDKALEAWNRRPK